MEFWSGDSRGKHTNSPKKVQCMYIVLMVLCFCVPILLMLSSKCMTGEIPWKDRDIVSLLMSIEDTSIYQLTSNLRPLMQEVLHMCLQLRPGKRKLSQSFILLLRSGKFATVN